MAQRTLAEFITKKQEQRLEDMFKKVLLAVPCEEGGPQRVIENEDTIREVLRVLLRGLAEPYYLFIGPEVEVVADYSLTLLVKTDIFKKDSAVTHLHNPNKESQTHLVRLVQGNNNSPSDFALARVLRSEGWEYADAWDLRAFVAKSPEIEDSPTGRSIYALGTQVLSENEPSKPVVAHLDRVVGKWGFGMGSSFCGPMLVRRIINVVLR